MKTSEPADTGGWARRQPPEKPKDCGEPPESWGALPNGPCSDCGGRYAHHALCPTGVEEEARRHASPERIAMVRRLLDREYSPYEDMLQAARAYEHEGFPECQLHHPGDWAGHYRAVAARVLELLPEAEKVIARDRSANGGGETAMQYLAREKRVAGMKPEVFSNKKPRMSRKAKAGDHGLFDADSIGSEAPHV